MAERAEREPTMEEIVVALRETRRGADRVRPFAVAGQLRGNRIMRATGGPADLGHLRDGEIERLLSENARLNERVVSLLKVIEQEQAHHAETTAENAPTEADREAIYREVRAAVEAEISPILLVLLRLLEKQRAETAAGDHGRRRVGHAATSGPSDWIVELMQKLEAEATLPTETIAAADELRRRPKLRQRMAEVLNALRFEPYAVPPRRRSTSTEEPI